MDVPGSGLLPWRSLAWAWLVLLRSLARTSSPRYLWPGPGPTEVAVTDLLPQRSPPSTCSGRGCWSSLLLQISLAQACSPRDLWPEPGPAEVSVSGLLPQRSLPPSYLLLRRSLAWAISQNLKVNPYCCRHHTF